LSAAGAADTSDPTRHILAVVKRSGTSFMLGMQLLPKVQRHAMYAIYAFGREVDDVADEEGTVEAKLAGLAGWREEVARLYAGQPTRPTTRALLEPVQRFGLPRHEFELLIEGMEMDARATAQAPTRDQLAAYTRRAAGSIGVLSIAVFGDTSADAHEFALTLGDALQLTNILRDVEEDAARDRLYLPAELLARHGIGAWATPAEVLAHPALPAVAAELGREARACYQRADQALARANRRRLSPALLMMGVYETVLNRLEQNGFRLNDPASRLTKREKLWAAFRNGYFRPAWRPACPPST